MIIDPYNVIFQVINFLVLVFLLRRFLYGPLVRAMDEREQELLRRESEAADRQKAAEAEEQQYAEERRSLAGREREILEQARREASEKKRDLLEESRREVEEARHRWEEDLARERDAFTAELRRRIARQACLVARRCLDDLADERLQDLAWSHFKKKMNSLDEEERQKLAAAITGGQVMLHTAFTLDEGQQKAVRDLLASCAGPGQELRMTVQTAEDLVCGFELEAGGYRLAWSVDSYLEGVERRIMEGLVEGIPGVSRAPAGEVAAGEG